jgi:pyruvate formate lyase activating enzyme
MIIGGMVRCSLIDYPGKIAAVVFLAVCNFRCPYCHNPHLVPGAEGGSVSEDEARSFLAGRRGLLDGVVLSGGEPTLQPGLPRFAAAVKAMGFSVKLDTNGSRPDMIEQLLEERLVDFIAMDLKAPPEKYEMCAGVRVDTGAIDRSAALIRSSGIGHLFRTTAARPLLGFADLAFLAGRVGEEPWVLQPCRTDVPLLDGAVTAGHRQYTAGDLERFCNKIDELHQRRPASAMERAVR